LLPPKAICQVPNYLIELLIENDEFFRGLIESKEIEYYFLIKIEDAQEGDILFELDDLSAIWCCQKE
jgi:hypothetical protein